MRVHPHPEESAASDEQRTPDCRDPNGHVERLSTGRGEAQEEKHAFRAQRPRECAHVACELQQGAANVLHLVLRLVIVGLAEVEYAPRDVAPGLEREEPGIHRQHKQAALMVHVILDRATALHLQPHEQVRGLQELDDAERAVLETDAVEPKRRAA